MSGFVILIIVFVILSRILEAGMKGGANTRRQPGRIPGQGRPRRPLPGTRLPPQAGSPTAGSPDQGRAADASDLIPAELWEILTGQRRIEEPSAPPPRPSAPLPQQQGPRGRMAASVPAPRTTMPTGPQDPEAEAAEEMIRRRDREWQAGNVPPKPVSLETEPLVGEMRDAAFHEELKHLSKPATVQRGRGPMDLELGTQSALRRAVVLQEVFGRPKGLED